MTETPAPLPRDERIDHVAHHIVEKGYPLTHSTWHKYGLRTSFAMQRHITEAVERLRAVRPPEGA